MGGLAFSAGPNPLYTPRMPLNIYLAVRNQCHEILSRYYAHVATPIEAPGKNDYGDVDFLVAGPAPGKDDPNAAESIFEALGAERRNKNSPTVSYALPWPKEGKRKAVADHDMLENKNQDHFVQVDVHVCGSKEGWEWELFQHAHGDLWNILGSTIRKKGLTVNNIGFYLRIEEIELTDRKKSMIILSKEPLEVLEFLGLDEARWWRQFGSAQEMFEYAASSRFFWANDAVKEVDEDKKELKHNDRKRMNHRPVFRQWIEEFIPQCRVQGIHRNEGPSRAQTREEACERFGVRGEYDEKVNNWRQERQMDEIWRTVIKGGVPTEDVDPELRAAALRGLKAIILNDDLSAGIIPPEPLIIEDGSRDMDKIVEFVKANWRQVGEVEFETQRKRAAEQMRLKELKRKANAAELPGT